MSGNKHSSGMKLLALLTPYAVSRTVSAQNPNEQLILINPHPATGAVDITGTVVMNRALRAMRNHLDH